ncbi:MAG: DNA primase, partial [Enterovibrio sp.]
DDNAAFSSGKTENKGTQKRDLYTLLGQISNFYQAQLRTAKGKPAIEYLKNRGLNGAIAKRFAIGFITDEWDQVLRQFGVDEAGKQALMDAGMLAQNEQGRRYDRFRGRIMFPIRDKSGRVLGFGGRVLSDQTPKYLNSPQTTIYHKGRELYGLYEVLQQHREPEKILVVEGYMDVVALAQFDIDYAVAALGTSTTAEQVQHLFRQTSTVICCYDGDRAGKEAAWRAMEQALPHLCDGRQLKFIFLPDGEDPDTMVRKEGREAFEARLTQALSLNEFLFSTLSPQVDLTSLAGKTKFMSLTMPLIEKMPQGAQREHLEHELSERVGFRYAHEIKKLVTQTTPAQGAPKSLSIKQTPMRTALALLLQNPHFAEHLPQFTGLPIDNMALFNRIVELQYKNPQITTGQLLECWRGTPSESVIIKLASWDLHLDDETAFNVFLDALDKILARSIQQQIDNLQQKDRNGGLNSNERSQLWRLLQSETA